LEKGKNKMDIIAIIQGFVDKYPVLASILLGMGIARAVFKPVFSILRTIVSATPSAKDDAVLDKVESSKAYKAVAYVLDYLASIKIAK
jgi:hypothetical protein